MSRIGRIPIPLPSGVKVDIKDGEVIVRGPKGEVHQTFPREITVTLKDNELIVSRPSDEQQHRAFHGLVRSLLANMVTGVNQGFSKELSIVGAGYRVQKVGDKLVLQVGYTTPVEVAAPAGITWVVEGTNRIKVQGIDKQQVGEVAAKLRAIRPPDHYKGKGIRYAGESVRLKPGKKAAGKKR